MTTPISSLRRPRSPFSLERMRPDRRVTWLTLIGLLLVPLVFGGLLVWALWNPADRLGDVRAAVVNLDQPVVVNGQTAPLGRQLAAGLLGTKNENFTWVLTDQKDANAGIADGSYVAVITIPKDFSHAATSTAHPDSTAAQATIDVRAGEKSKLVDPAISQAVTATATSVLNKQLTATYLENVYIEFNTLHDQLATAAAGAGSLATGVTQLASGTHQLADSATQLASGATSLTDGVGQLSAAAAGLSDGLGALSSNLTTLANGMAQLQQQTASLPDGAQQLANGATGVSSGVSFAAKLAKTALDTCIDEHTLADPACQAIAQSYSIMTTAHDGQPSVADGAAQLATGASALAGNASAIVSGITQSASGAQALADGATQSATGAAQLSGGVAQSAAGASGLANGLTQFAAGVPAIASGADQSAAGAASLASGLDTAVAQLPSYDSNQRTNLAHVASQPVGQNESGTTAFGTSSIPLFASVALWLGALSSFLVLQAISRRALLTSRAASLIATDGLLPATTIGIAQGALVAAIMQPAMQLSVGAWFSFVAVAAATAACFATINHGLVALLGGAGRFVAMLIGVLTLASGIVSTTPEFFSNATAWLPTSPAITAMQGAVDGAPGVWQGLGGLLLWAGVGFALALIAVARRRIVTAAQLLPAE